MGRRRTTVSVYEVPSFLRDANLAAFMLNFGDIVSATHDGMRGEWRFDLTSNIKTYSVPNWLDVEGRRLPVIVSGRKPACWHCGEIVTSPQFAQGRRPRRSPTRIPAPPTCWNKQREKGGSRSLAHFSGNKKPHSPYVFYG